MSAPILRVAVPSPLRRCFDYLAPAGGTRLLEPGMRVTVPFGRRQLVGVIVGVDTSSEIPGDRLRPVRSVIDAEPILPPELVTLLAWAMDYYHHAPGEVLSAALPAQLRKGGANRAEPRRAWRLTEAGRRTDPDTLKSAPRQSGLLRRLGDCPEGLAAEELNAEGGNWRTVMAKLVDKGWVEGIERPCLASPVATDKPRPRLNEDQEGAVKAVAESLHGFAPFLLDGVTGSGKTEVYLSAIEEVLATGRQALVLVPEIGLTPQLLERFRSRLGVPIAVLHSGLSDGERLCGWTSAARGEAPVVIGTRSAVFVPLARPGIIIVDEEHDGSFKQQDGFRYSARDIAVMRAARIGIPVVLGSATPSLESLCNVEEGRYRRLHLPQRAGSATHPSIRLLDVRGRPLQEGLSEPLLKAMERHLGDGNQVLLFLNRRGYAPTLLCHECGWVAECDRCDAHLTLHRSRGTLSCHHCASERRIDDRCRACGSADLRPLGLGTERVEATIAERFPDIPVVRIDRDSTRRKGAMSAMLDRTREDGPLILIGTQMIAKGHHLPAVTLVGIVDVDQGLFSADFRAGERMAQLIIQVAGRAGRAERAGQVLIQTHHPDHPLLRLLVEHGYHAFAEAALAERRMAELPPFTHMALLRAEAVDETSPTTFLEHARSAAMPLLGPAGVELEGPVPAPMERRAGRFRAQISIRSGSRPALHRFLGGWLPQVEALKTGRRVRWSLDVDPAETF